MQTLAQEKILIILRTILDEIKTEIEKGETAKRYLVRKDPNDPMNKFDLRPKKFISITANPGVGKTTLIGNLLFDALIQNEDINVLNFNVEMDFKQLVYKELARCCRIPFNEFYNNTIKENGYLPNFQEGYKHLETLQDRYFYFGNGTVLEDVDETFHALDGRMRPDIIVLDYAQRIRTNDNFKTTLERMNRICDSCRKIVQDYNCCIIAVCSTDKDSSKSKTSLYSARDSSEFMFSPDDVIGIDRTDKRTETNETVLQATWHKKRFGQTESIYLAMEGEYCSFRPVSLNETMVNPKSEKKK